MVYATVRGYALALALLFASITVDVSVYWAVAGQTDSDPLQPADLEVSYAGAVEAGERHCALSQDLLWFTGGPANFGDRVLLLDKRFPDEWRVSDTMHEAYRQKLDLLMPVGTLESWNDITILILPKRTFFGPVPSRGKPRRGGLQL